MKCSTRNKPGKKASVVSLDRPDAQLQLNTNEKGIIVRAENNLKGLRGWLILVGIGLVFSPIKLIATYYPIFLQILTDGTWEILTTQGSVAYHPLWGPLLTGEIMFNSGMVLFFGYLLYLFFTRHYLFPKVYIIMMTISVAFIPLDAWVTTVILPNEPVFDPATTKELLRAALGMVIWVPYMLVSKRVKATFVEKSSDKHMQPTPECAG